MRDGDENLNCTVKQTGRCWSHVEKVLPGIEWEECGKESETW